MESLKLEKFKDAKLSENQLVNCFGGASSKQESCNYATNWHTQDSQTDFYSDDCDDGNYSYVGSCTMEHEIISDAYTQSC